MTTTDDFRSLTGMSQGRYEELMDDQSARINNHERQAGWHFCRDWDGLLVGPGMTEMESCGCGVKEQGDAN